MSTRPIFTNYRPPVPGPDASGEELLAYVAAWEQWCADRRTAGYADRIAVAEQEQGHAAAQERVEGLS